MNLGLFSEKESLGRRATGDGLAMRKTLLEDLDKRLMRFQIDVLCFGSTGRFRATGTQGGEVCGRTGRDCKDRYAYRTHC